MSGTRSLPWIVAALSLALLAGWTFGGALPGLGSRLLGFEYVDAYGTQWFYWYVGEALRGGQWPTHTDLFFHPWGKDLFAHTGSNVLDALLAQPLLALFGRVTGYNLFVLGALAANGLAFAWAARVVTDDRLARLVGAVLFAFTPFALFELAEGRPTQALLLFPVLFVGWTLRASRRRGLVAPLLAGVALAAAGYQYWYYAFFGGLAALAHGLVSAARPAPEAGGGLRVLGRYALIAAVALALTAPVAYRLALGHDGDDALPGMLDTDRWSLRANPPETVAGTTVGLFLWQPQLRQTGAYIQDADGVERFLFRGAWMPLLLWLALALWLARPGGLPRGPTLAVLAVSLLVALGPLLLVGRLGLPNPLYIAAAKALPFFQRLWWPARAFAFFAIPAHLALVAVLAGLARRGAYPQAGVALAAAGLWALELQGMALLPFPSWDATVPAGYRCLAQGPPGALVELPYSWTQAHVYYQVEHGRPILGGMIENNPEFSPAEATAFRTDNSFVAALLSTAKLARDTATWTDDDRADAHTLGYRYVVVQKDAYHEPGEDQSLVDNARRTRLRRMERVLLRTTGRPVYEDARIAIYAPWGDPCPCAPGTIEPDPAQVGRTDLAPEELFQRSFEQQIVHRLLSPPDVLDEGDDDSASEGDDVDEDSAGERAGDDDSAGPLAEDDDSASIPPEEDPETQDFTGDFEDSPRRPQ